MVTGGLLPGAVAFDLAFLIEKLPLLSTLIVPTFLVNPGFVHGSPGPPIPLQSPAEYLKASSSVPLDETLKLTGGLKPLNAPCEVNPL